MKLFEYWWGISVKETHITKVQVEEEHLLLEEHKLQLLLLVVAAVAVIVTVVTLQIMEILLHLETRLLWVVQVEQMEVVEQVVLLMEQVEVY